MKTLARDRDKAEILERLRALQPTSTRRWGRMSAHQMVCHVSDCCRMLTGQRTVAEAPSRLLPRAIVRWIALYLPLRWPPGIHTSPELDQYGGGTRAVEFAADVAELAALLDEIATGPAQTQWPEAPRVWPDVRGGMAAVGLPARGPPLPTVRRVGTTDCAIPRRRQDKRAASRR